MSALYLTKDLFFSSRLGSAAAVCGLELNTVGEETELLTLVKQGGVHLVVLEFGSPDLDLLSLVPRIRETAPTPVTIIAFGPHVDVAGLSAARQAGCDEVYTRGQLNNQMGSVLRKHGCVV